MDKHSGRIRTRTHVLLITSEMLYWGIRPAIKPRPPLSPFHFSIPQPTRNLPVGRSLPQDHQNAIGRRKTQRPNLLNTNGMSYWLSYPTTYRVLIPTLFYKHHNCSVLINEINMFNWQRNLNLKQTDRFVTSELINNIRGTYIICLLMLKYNVCVAFLSNSLEINLIR